MDQRGCFLWDAPVFAACSGLQLPQCHWREEGEVQGRRLKIGSSTRQMAVSVLHSKPFCVIVLYSEHESVLYVVLCKIHF